MRGNELEAIRGRERDRGEKAKRNRKRRKDNCGGRRGEVLILGGREVCVPVFSRYGAFPGGNIC